jgi:hypothetical protein
VNAPEGVRMLQFERKLALTIEMVEAFRQFTGGSLSPAQEAELNQWANWLGSQYAIVQRAFEPPN